MIKYKNNFCEYKCMELLHTFVCASIWCLSQFSFLLSLNGNLRKGLKFFFFLSSKTAAQAMTLYNFGYQWSKGKWFGLKMLVLLQSRL
uniref:Uncharacterized protein n=1 Tax=Anguilla anguilla TaxID=7936 RepID=A0A0E9SUQ6_ANGAN